MATHYFNPVNELARVVHRAARPGTDRATHVGMVIGTLRLLPPPNRRRDVLEILTSIQGPVQTQPGCLSCHVYEGQGDDTSIVLVERWASEEALEAHIRSDAYHSILGALELSGSPPEVSFEHVSETEGMGLIERVRNPGHTESH